MASPSSKNELSDVYYYPLWDAIKNGNKTTADIDKIKEDTGLGLLHLACINKNVAAVKLLLVYNPNINLPTVEINKQANLESRVPVGSTPLSIAVNNSDVTITKLLLEKNHNVNDVNYVDLFNIAIYKGCKEIIEVLLTFGADINATDHGGNTPLHCSTMSYDMYENRYPSSAIVSHHTYHYVQPDMVEYLLKNEANVNAVDKNEMTPLYYACEAKRFDIILVLLSYNPNVNARNKNDQTPLHVLFDENFKLTDYNTFTQMEQVCDRFVELKVDINAVDSEGRTVLFNACMYGYDLIVGILLKHNANVHIPNRYGKTPIHVAADAFYDKILIIQMLIEHNADVNFVDENKNTILHLAAKPSYVDVTFIFDKIDVDINAKNREGKTALAIAVENAAMGMVRILITKGADINMRTTNNRNILDNIAEGIVAYEQYSEYEKTHSHQNPNHWEHMVLCDITILQFTEILLTLVGHVIKLHTAGLYVNNEMVNFVYDDKARKIYKLEHIVHNISQYDQQYKEEIQKLKEEYIFNTTYYNLLIKDCHIMARVPKIKEILRILSSNDYDRKFPLYINIIRNHLKACEIRSGLLKTIETYDISSFFYNLPYICINEILRFLNNEDLKVFLSVLNPQYLP